MATQKTGIPNQYVLDDGTREITLVNKQGQVICKLHFRTSEIDIVERFRELEASLPDIVAPLSKLRINPDGTAGESSDEDAWGAMKKAERILKDKINALLDMDEADEIFKTRNPFSSIGGEFFVTRVIEVLGKAITDAISEEAKLTQERIAKYTNDLG